MATPSTYRETVGTGQKVYKYEGNGIYRHVATIRARLPALAFGQRQFSMAFYPSDRIGCVSSEPPSREPKLSYRFRWERFRLHRTGDNPADGVLRDILTTTEDLSEIDSKDLEHTIWGDTLEGKHV